MAVKIAYVVLRVVEDLRRRSAAGTRARHWRRCSRCADISGAQAVNVARVRNLDDLVALHDIAADARHARVRLVVHEQVAAVVGAVGERHVRMVQVAVVIGAHPALRQKILRLRQQSFGQNLEALVGDAPAGGAAAVEHGHAHQLAHGRHTEDAHLAGLAARPEAVIFVELTGRQFELLAGALGHRRRAEPSGRRRGERTGSRRQRGRVPPSMVRRVSRGLRVC